MRCPARRERHMRTSLMRRLLGAAMAFAYLPPVLPAQRTQFVSMPAVVEVSPAGPVRTVAEALRRVASGGRVIVRAGVYREPTIEVTRPVTLEGERGAVLD